MPNKLYLALVQPNFILNDQVRQYFAEEEIEVVKYLGKLSLLILKSKQPLTAHKLRYIDYVEPESNFNLFSNGIV